MSRKRVCVKCDRHAEFPAIVTCKIKNVKLCKNCCVNSLKSFGDCSYWHYCWPTYYI